MTEPLPPDTFNGPTEADEDQVLQYLYGDRDVDGVYRTTRYLPSLTAADVLSPVGVEAMIAAARSSLGMGEPNSIQRWYADRNGSAFNYNFPWCEASLTFWAYHSGNYDQVCPRGDRAYTVYGAQDGMYLGRWYAGTEDNVRNYCKRGAKVYYDWSGSNTIGAIDHVGVCEYPLADGRVQTIEGNTANVCARRIRASNVIAGFWVPAYVVPPPAPAPAPDTNWTEKIVKNLPNLKTGSKGEDVQSAQHLLLARSQKLPRYGADGDYGNETVAAVKSFQRAAGLSQTGVVDAPVWAKLLRVA